MLANAVDDLVKIRGRLRVLRDAAAPGEWRTWYTVCIVCVVVFIATNFVMRGRWSPALARADEAAHDADVARELASLQSRPEARSEGSGTDRSMTYERPKKLGLLPD
jgi:hypothetical protein